nr:putative ribonuclease H-like domain-containing protein [Tanacetum cinerariifolium]
MGVEVVQTDTLDVVAQPITAFQLNSYILNFIESGGVYEKPAFKRENRVSSYTASAHQLLELHHVLQNGIRQLTGAKKECGLSPKAKVRVLHTAQLDVTVGRSGLKLTCMVGAGFDAPFFKYDENDDLPTMVEDYLRKIPGKFQKAPSNVCGEANISQHDLKDKNEKWIFDCGATDTMSYELSDFKALTKPKKTNIQTANGGRMNVQSGGTVEISPRIKLPNSLYDIKTGQIIGRGTENQGLYYVDEVTQSGTVMLAHGTTEREAWLWHRRLGHPSAGALIIESHVPKMFWPEALATSTYLLNRLPTKILKLKTPLETLEEYTKIPPILTLQPKVFGCTVFVHIPKSYRDKLDPCAEKCVFVGYGVNQKGYRCYNPKTRRMFTTMNCDFLETKYYYSPQPSGQGEDQYDTLSWLSSSTVSGDITASEEKSPVHGTTQSEDHNSATEDISPNLISEVCNSQPNEPHDEFAETVNTATESEPTNEDVQEQGESIVEPAKYVLPARANRGIPAKRYSPKRISKGSKNFGEVSNKSDVYSYGMMILEMFNGKKNNEVEADQTSKMYFPHAIYKRIELIEEQLGLHGIVSDEENDMAQQISESRRFVNRIREEVQTCHNQIAHLNALIAKMEAFDDPGEVFDTLMGLRDDVRVEQAKLMGLNELVSQVEEEIEMNEAQPEVDYCIWCVCFEELDAYLTVGSLEKVYIGPFFILDKLSEVVESPRLVDKMKYMFSHLRGEDELFAGLMCDLCLSLRVSLSKKRRLVAELEAVGEVEGVVKCLEMLSRLGSWKHYWDVRRLG